MLESVPSAVGALSLGLGSGSMRNQFLQSSSADDDQRLKIMTAHRRRLRKLVSIHDPSRCFKRESETELESAA